MSILFRQPMSKESLQRYYPSIFATSQKETLSEQYLQIPTFKLIEAFEKNGFHVVGAKQTNVRKGSQEHAKHVVYLSQNETEELSHVGNEIPLLALTNSHNGRSAQKLDTSIFRVACLNGLMLPTSTLHSARVTHKVGMQNEVIDAAFRVVTEFPETLKQIESMKGVLMTQDESMILAETARNLVFTEEQIALNNTRGIDIRSNLLRPRRSVDRSNDLWTTFNVIQENVIKGGMRVLSQNDKGDVSLRKTRKVGAIDRDAKLNKELMAMAIAMRELKLGA